MTPGQAAYQRAKQVADGRTVPEAVGAVPTFRPFMHVCLHSWHCIRSTIFLVVLACAAQQEGGGKHTLALAPKQSTCGQLLALRPLTAELRHQAVGKLQRPSR